MVTILLAFIEGFALIISPCILPILPIVLSGSLSGNKARPVGIIIGFVLTFTLVTVFSRSVIAFLHVSPDVIRNASLVILLLLGIVMMSAWLTEKFARMTQGLANVGGQSQLINPARRGIVGGLLFGGLVGVIWTPCAGPILAAVIVQVVIQKTTLASIWIVMAFGLGAGIPMLLIALIGRRMMDRFHFFRAHAETLRKLLGFIIIASVVYLFYNSSIPFSKATSTNDLTTNKLTLVNGLEHPYSAPEIAGIDAWINSPPLQLSHLKGKVVLIDFWTYSCINCIRSLPYLKNWYARYHDKGLEIIGIHSPEFAFEHSLENVKQAVTKYGITYPVALDNRFVTWQSYKNEYWPAHYLINKQGEVVYQHFGEGEYDTTENNIRFLLGMTKEVQESPSEENYFSEQTPETYFGYMRAEHFANSEAITKNKPADYHYPAVLPENSWALQGKWIIYPDKIVAASAGASIKLRYYAAKVYVVMGTKTKNMIVTLWRNHQLLSNEKGSEVNKGRLQVKQQRLYTLVNLNLAEGATLELKASDPGLEMYTFTFGN